MVRKREHLRGTSLEQDGKIKCAAVLKGTAACLHIFFRGSCAGREKRPHLTCTVRRRQTADATEKSAGDDEHIKRR